jgi:hypothetical protein
MHQHQQALTKERGVLCGASGCLNAAEIWLTNAEESKYRGGIRTFWISHRAGSSVTLV